MRRKGIKKEREGWRDRDGQIESGSERIAVLVPVT